MRMLIATGCMVLLLAGCRSEEPAQPVAIEAPEAATTTEGTVLSDTITPGTTERAATATGTVAPTPATRTTTSAPPGTTVTAPPGTGT